MLSVTEGLGFSPLGWGPDPAKFADYIAKLSDVVVHHHNNLLFIGVLYAR